MKINLPTLYKYTNAGNVQEWTITVEGNTYYTTEGIMNGKLTKSKPTIREGKNIGKSNETSPNKQALQEAQSKWQKKVDKGYNEILKKEKNFFEPMLAYEREEYEKLLFTIPTYIQPKLDGCRAILKDGKLTSRNGKQIVSCPHLEIPNWFLDGELYSHELKGDFNKIISLTRKSKPTQEDLNESAKIVEYWIYDCPGKEGTFTERFVNTLLYLHPDYKFKRVPTDRVYNLNDIEWYHNFYLEQGYEGTMIRLDLGPYENKRSKQLLKYKNFKDAEFEILEVIEGEGNRSGVAGKLICKLPNGNTVGVSMTGTQEFMRQVLQDRSKIIGLQATVKFFDYTPDGSLRFPVLKNIIDYT